MNRPRSSPWTSGSTTYTSAMVEDSRILGTTQDGSRRRPPGATLGGHERHAQHQPDDTSNPAAQIPTNRDEYRCAEQHEIANHVQGADRPARRLAEASARLARMTGQPGH